MKKFHPYMERTLKKLRFIWPKSHVYVKCPYIAKKESETGIRCTKFDEIPAKSPDASPMNCYAFGLLKSALRKRHP
ncbi:hypothetical protein TNCV_3951741 [Trichonephila clavipes]|nr:hypothetical protein TNCV_3951741 [Trichonephila clavipes]